MILPLCIIHNTELFSLNTPWRFHILFEYIAMASSRHVTLNCGVIIIRGAENKREERPLLSDQSGWYVRGVTMCCIMLESRTNKYRRSSNE